MDYIEKLELQTEEVKEVESLEKHKIIISEPFSVNKYKGHTDEFLAVDGDYDDGFNQLNETNGLAINCIVSKRVNELKTSLDNILAKENKQIYSNVMVNAHGGFSSEVPENSISAFEVTVQH